MNEAVILIKNTQSFVSYFQQRRLQCRIYDRPSMRTIYIQVKFGKNACYFIMPSSYVIRASDIENIVKKIFESVASNKIRSNCNICCKSYYENSMPGDSLLQMFALCPLCQQLMCHKCYIVTESCRCCSYVFHEEDAPFNYTEEELLAMSAKSKLPCV